MRRAILWLDENWPVAVFCTFLVLVGAFFLSGARVGFRVGPQNISFAIYSTSVLYVVGFGAGVRWVTTDGWPRLVAWAKAPPKIAPAPPGDAFLESAKREVDAIAPEG